MLQRLADQLARQPISLIVTDPTGVVLAQRTGDLDLHRHLEHAELVPGVSSGAQYRGTNGIDTTLGGGRAMHVFGPEHYGERPENPACRRISACSTTSPSARPRVIAYKLSTLVDQRVTERQESVRTAAAARSTDKLAELPAIDPARRGGPRRNDRTERPRARLII